MFDERAVEDLGDWRRFGPDETNKDEKGKPKIVEFRIRAVPDEVGRQIYRRHFGRKQKYLMERGGQQATEVDLDKSREAAIDKAVYALTGAKNFRVRPKDGEVYTTLLGRPVKAGDWISLDADVTRDNATEEVDPARQLKEHIFSQFDSLVTWIIEQSDEQKTRAEEDEGDLKS